MANDALPCKHAAVWKLVCPIFHKLNHDVKKLPGAATDALRWFLTFRNIRLSHVGYRVDGIILYQHQAPRLVSSFPDQTRLGQIPKVQVNRARRGEASSHTDIPHRGGIAVFGYVPPQELVDLLLGLQTLRRLMNAVIVVLLQLKSPLSIVVCLQRMERLVIRHF